MIKLLSQFEQVESATPLARSEEGKLDVSDLDFETGQVGFSHLAGHSPRHGAPASAETKHVK